jgi:zinc transport system substrate-binding protein
MRNPTLVVFAILAGVLLWGCAPRPAEQGPAAEEEADGRLVVYTVNYPLAYLAKRIGGEYVRVEFPAPRDGDPAFWRPDAGTIGAYQGADLILLNGAGYAKWVPMAALPSSKLVDTGAGFQDRFIHSQDRMTHSHGPEGAHSHGETAFTTWLDLTLAVRHAHAVRNAFADARPEHEAAFQRGLEKVERDLMNLDRQIALLTAGQPDVLFLGSHPVYQYLARRYGLKLASVHFEPDVVPDDKAWDELKKLLRGHPARWMLWEGEPLPETAARLRELGVESVVCDPCGNVPAKGDFLSVMWDNLGGLERVYSNS